MVAGHNSVNNYSEGSQYLWRIATDILTVPDFIIAKKTVIVCVMNARVVTAREFIANTEARVSLISLLKRGRYLLVERTTKRNLKKMTEKCLHKGDNRAKRAHMFILALDGHGFGIDHLIISELGL